MDKNVKYIIYLIVAVLMFSTFEVVSKSMMQGAITPTQLTFYRFLIGGLFLLPLAIRDLKVHNIKFSFKLILSYILMGFMLVFVSMNMSQIGISYSSASLTAILFSSNPLFVSLFSTFILKEKLTSGKITGLIIGVVGLFIACAHLIISPYNVTSKFILGVILIIFAMLVFAFYTVLNKKMTVKYGSIVCTSMSSIFGAITLIPVIVYNGVSSGINPFAFNFPSIAPQFLYLSIAVTGLSYFLYFDAISNLDTTISSMSFLVKPPIASILAAIFLGEVITPNIIIGLVFILFGVFISIKLGSIKK